MRMLSQHMALEALAARQDPQGSAHAPQPHYASFQSAHAAPRDGGSAYGRQVQPLDQRLQWQRPCVRLGQMGCSHHLAMADSQLQSGPKPML